MLRSNGSWGTCIPHGVFTFPPCAFHGARKVRYKRQDRASSFPPAKASGSPVHLACRQTGLEAWGKSAVVANLTPSEPVSMPVESHAWQPGTLRKSVPGAAVTAVLQQAQLARRPPGLCAVWGRWRGRPGHALTLQEAQLARSEPLRWAPPAGRSAAEPTAPTFHTPAQGVRKQGA